MADENKTPVAASGTGNAVQRRADEDAKRAEAVNSEGGDREPREFETRNAQFLAPKGDNVDPNYVAFDPFKGAKEKGYMGWTPDPTPNEDYTLTGQAKVAAKKAEGK